MSITLFNAGRGAGKTYTLVQWAKEDPKRLVVGDTHTRDALHAAGIKDQFVYRRDAEEDLRARKVTEVAFDDFNSNLYEMLYRDFGLVPEVSVILATTLLEHEKKQDWTDLASKLRQATGFKLVEDTVEKVFSFIEDTINESEPAPEKEPASDTKTQDIKARFLWLGARLADGTGSVTSLRYEDNGFPEKSRLVAEVKGPVFEGKLRLGVNDSITVFTPSGK